MSEARKPAVVLVSGGMDSAVVLAIAREAGFDAYALSVRYGQRHTSELDAADRVSNALGASVHKTVHVDLRSIGGSALTNDIAAVSYTHLDVYKRQACISPLIAVAVRRSTRCRPVAAARPGSASRAATTPARR